MAILVQQSEATASLRRMYFHCVDATDGMAPETGEAAGQPQISLNGAAWGNTTNTLVAIGNGRYYVELVAATEVNSLGIIEGRYKSANTAEAIGTTLQVVPFDPYDGVRAGLTALPNAAANAAGGLPISAGGGLALDTQLANTNEITAARMGVLTDWINDGRLDAILDIIAADTTTDIPATLTTIAAYLDTEIGAIVAAVITNAAGVDIAADIIAVKAETALIVEDTNELQTDDYPTTLATLATPAQVNAQVLDVLNVDTFAEPGQEAPAATTTLVKKIGYLYKFLRNKVTNDGTNIKVYNDAGAVVDQKNTVSEAAGTVTRGKFGTGP